MCAQVITVASAACITSFAHVTGFCYAISAFKKYFPRVALHLFMHFFCILNVLPMEK